METGPLERGCNARENMEKPTLQSYVRARVASKQKDPPLRTGLKVGKM